MVFINKKKQTNSISMNLVSDDVVEALMDYSLNEFKFLAPEIRFQLGRKMVESYIVAASLKVWVINIRSVVDLSEDEAEELANRALKITFHIANMKSYKEAGIKKVQYLSVNDNHTLPVCREDNNKIYTIGQAPKLPHGKGCRCTTVAVFED